MTSDPHTILILRTIREHANDRGIAWWSEVGPVLEPFGLEWSDVAAVRSKGLIEPSTEIGRLRLTPAGLRRIS